MVQTLYTIGKILAQHEEYEKYFELWENPFNKEAIAENAKVIVVNLKDGRVRDIQIEAFSKQKIKKYLFRSIRGANGTNLVPTFYFQLSGKADVEKWQKEQENNLRKLTKKIRQSLKNYEHDFLEEGEVDRLQELLLEKAEDLNKGDSHLLTMRIDGNYFGDFEIYRNLFEEEAYSKYYDKSSATNKVCAVSYQTELEVWGKVDTLGFTTNDIAFSRNGFSDKQSYKMLPVSPEAVKLLEGGKKIVDNELTRSFYNLKYFILPHFIQRNNEEVIEETLEAFLNNCKSDSLQTTASSIINNEQVLYAITQEEELQNAVYYDILFFQQQQAQFLIKLHLTDIIPSRIAKVFWIKEQLEKRYRQITKTTYIDKKTKEAIVREFYINFKVIKDFFSKKVKNDYVFQPQFFKIVEAVFQGTKLNEQQILQAFMEKIKKDFKNQQELSEWEFQRQTKVSFVLYQYFLHLGLFKNKTIMEEKMENTNPLNAEDFIMQHSDFFDSDYKKGVFLLGCLSSYLMGKQFVKLNSKPFMNQLNSLRIDKKIIMQIFPKLINKLREYDAPELPYEQKIAKYLVDNQNIPNTEISYVFTLGLVMQKEFVGAYLKAKKERESSEPVA
ncbi:MAG: TIGR02556 family CRISPR-associated protein [Bacteroidota bacterium]